MRVRIQPRTRLGDVPFHDDQGNPLGILWGDGTDLAALVARLPELESLARSMATMGSKDQFAKVRRQAQWLVKRLDAGET